MDQGHVSIDHAARTIIHRSTVLPIDRTIYLLFLIFSRFYVGSMCLMRRLHLARSCVSSLDNYLSDKSFLMLPNHLLFGLPLLLFPGTSIAITLLPMYSSSLLSTCPYHFNLLSCTFLDISPPSLSLSGLDIGRVGPVARGASRFENLLARGVSRFENLLAPQKTYWPPKKLTGPYLKTKLARRKTICINLQFAHRPIIKLFRSHPRNIFQIVMVILKKKIKKKKN